MAPLVTDQTKLTLACAGTEAVRPVAPADAWVGAERVALGRTGMRLSCGSKSSAVLRLEEGALEAAAAPPAMKMLPLRRMVEAGSKRAVPRLAVAKSWFWVGSRISEEVRAMLPSADPPVKKT